VARLKILDPACGSGSFLLAAYQALIDWHINYYGDRRRLTSRDRNAAYIDEEGRVRLTAHLKRSILVKNLFGVDIDPQAVEVTCFSLSLKALEDTRRNELAEERSLFRETILPDLGSNIKCGNSLVDHDLREGEQADFLLDGVLLGRLKPFDWRDVFSDVVDAGGFDAVIGNPPYRKERESKELIADLRLSRFGDRYYEGKMDFWYYFLHRAIDLVRDHGYISFIVPSYWLKSTGASKLVQHVRKDCRFVDVVDFGKNKVFKNVGGQHMVFVLAKGGPARSVT
jgi:adenine-specific DNA-methyltransferase